MNLLLNGIHNRFILSFLKLLETRFSLIVISVDGLK